MLTQSDVSVKFAKVSVLVRAAITKYHGLGALDNKHFFLMVLEARSRCRQIRRVVRPHFLVGCFLAVSSSGTEQREGKQALLCFFIRVLTPFVRALT